MPQMQGNALEISLDFQFGPIPAIFSAHAPGPVIQRCNTSFLQLAENLQAT